MTYDGKPAIRIAGFEQCKEGEEFSIYPVTEGSTTLQRTLTFVNNGGPQPNGNCNAISPLSFPGIEFNWVETNSFPVSVTITVHSEQFMGDQHRINPDWVTDHTAHLSPLVRKNFSIPIDFWVGGVKTMFHLEFSLEYTRKLTPAQEKEWKDLYKWGTKRQAVIDASRKRRRDGVTDPIASMKEWWFLISSWISIMIRKR